MSAENIGFICLAVAFVWSLFGGFTAYGLVDPKNNKQLLIILILIGPIMWVVFLVLIASYFVKEIYKKMGE